MDIVKLIDPKILKRMLRTFLFIAPLVFITNQIFIFWFGHYSIDIGKYSIINALILNWQSALYSSSIFAILWVIAYGLKMQVFPLIGTLVGRANTDTVAFRKASIIGNKCLLGFYGYSVWERASILSKAEIYPNFTSPILLLMLWTLAISPWVALFSLPFTLLLTVYFFRVVNTIYHEYNRDQQ